MNPAKMQIWFPAKRYGWGWGLPNCWQGWLVMLAWMILLGAGGVLLMPEHPGLFFGCTVTVAVILIAICFLTGEKSRWRWGKD